MTLRSKIFFSQALFLLAPLVAALGAAGFLVTAQQHQSLEQQAVAASTAVRNSMAVAADAARTGALRSMVRNNLVIIQSLYQKSLTGSLSLYEARWLALETFTNRTANTYGTLFCIDSRGLILAHPDTSLVRTPLAPTLFARLRRHPQAVFQLPKRHAFPPVCQKRIRPLGWTIVASIPSRNGQILPMEHLSSHCHHFRSSRSTPLCWMPPDIRPTCRPAFRARGKPLLDQLPATRPAIQRLPGLDPVPDNPLDGAPCFSSRSPTQPDRGRGGADLVLGRPWTRLLHSAAGLLPAPWRSLAWFLSGPPSRRPLQRLATASPDWSKAWIPGNAQGRFRGISRIIACCNQMMSALHEQRQKLSRSRKPIA